MLDIVAILSFGLETEVLLVLVCKYMKMFEFLLQLKVEKPKRLKNRHWLVSISAWTPRNSDIGARHKGLQPTGVDSGVAWCG